MGRAQELMDKINAPLAGITVDGVKQAFEKKLQKLGFEGVYVEDVEVDVEGDVIVTFSDDDRDELDVLFTYDHEDGPLALLLGEDEDDEDSDVMIIDLAPSNPSIKQTVLGKFIDVTNLEWLNKSIVTAMFRAGDIGDDQEIVVDTIEDTNDIEERAIAVIRGGKKVKLAVVRKRKRTRLTPQQKQGIRKGVMKRKARSAQIQRKRKKSLKIRKRMNLKTKPKGTKVRGG